MTLETSNNTKKQIVLDRLRFLAEVLIVFFGIFLFMLIPIIILPLIMDKSSIIFGPLFYLLLAVAIILAIPLFLFISNIVLESLVSVLV